MKWLAPGIWRWSAMGNALTMLYSSSFKMDLLDFQLLKAIVL
jgi:hypothetical protein